ncbi:MAG: efflux transporter outer membrane subunit [Thermoguttaceae bacterium]
MQPLRIKHPAPIDRCAVGLLVILATALSGCTSLRDYVHNGFKVGPNYSQPSADVAGQWIDADDQRVSTNEEEQVRWWTVFDDEKLNGLIDEAYRQNLSLREAGCRVLEARAQLGIATGQLFPQSQNITGGYSRDAFSRLAPNTEPIQTAFADQWNYGFNLSWELDCWGRFRRAVESNRATWVASIEDYDATLVTLLGDMASNYVQMRTIQERIACTEANVHLQRETLTITEARFRGGTTSELDVFQARSTLEQTQAQIAELQIQLRQVTNQLCILLGKPPEELVNRLGHATIPTAPTEAIVGIPADLLRRRPDVRKAERLAAAQCAEIGVAEADFYPAFSINGTLGYSAQQFGNVFRPRAFNSSVGPSFQWNVLNYGRLLNDVRFQNAKFQELVFAYQQKVLNANREAENGLVTFLRAQQRTKHQAVSVQQAQKAVVVVLAQYKAGTADFTRVTQVEQALVQQEDVLAQARGEIATGLIQVYRALGGGWQIRLDDQASSDSIVATTPSPAAAPTKPPKSVDENLPIPIPEPSPITSP